MLIINSCVFDSLHKFVVFKNQSNSDVIVVYSINDTITDDVLFYGSNREFKANSVEDWFESKMKFNKLNFFIFNRDSVIKYEKQKQVSGIVKNSFLLKITVTNESLKRNDTVTYKGK